MTASPLSDIDTKIKSKVITPLASTFACHRDQGDKVLTCPD